MISWTEAQQQGRTRQQWIASINNQRRGGGPSLATIPFSSLMNRHPDSTLWIVGAGKTDFDYEKLADGNPAIFINMAVDMDRHVAADRSYFIAQDDRQKAYFPFVHGTAVLPLGGYWRGREDELRVLPQLCTWRNSQKGVTQLLYGTRHSVAEGGMLYRGREHFGGTSVPACHLAWYLGAKHVRFVGCDGLAVDYDPRLTNRTGQRIDDPVGRDRFRRFRQEQTLVLGRLGVTWEYVGTPAAVLDRWRAVDAQADDLLLDPTLALAIPWDGLPAARFDGEGFNRVLVETQCTGHPGQATGLLPVKTDQPMPDWLGEELQRRRKWLETYVAPAQPVLTLPDEPPPPFQLNPPCVFRGPFQKEVDCPTCGGTVKVKTFHCAVHGLCNLGKKRLPGLGVPCVGGCDRRQQHDGRTHLIPFPSFKDKYAGREGWIIGRGPTPFDPEALRQVTDPIWFINEAIDWERYVAHDDSFGISLEWRKFKDWAYRCKSVVMMGFLEPHEAAGIKRLVMFKHVAPGAGGGPTSVKGGNWFRLAQSANELAESRMLYQYGSSMLPAIHFAWFCGIRTLNLVGCDGLATELRSGLAMTSLESALAYNPNLPVFDDDGNGRSGGIHPLLRKRHDAAMQRLGIKANYLFSPASVERDGVLWAV